MVTEGELLGQKRTIEERKLGLERFQAEWRRICGEIGYLTYRRNSGIGNRIGQDEAIRALKKELKSQAAALRRDYGLTPRRVPQHIGGYEREIFRIGKQMERQDRPKGQEPSDPAADPERITRERVRVKTLADRLTETGVVLLAQQAAQEPARPSSPGEERQHGFAERWTGRAKEPRGRPPEGCPGRDR